MALFSLLLALMIERTVELSNRWQFQHWFERFVNHAQKNLEPTSISFQLYLTLLPPLLTYFLLDLLSGFMFGLVSLLLWTSIILLCICCIDYRGLYKQYLLSVCKKDTLLSYELAAKLADIDEIRVEDETCLGSRVGRQLSWINFRFYCAIMFMTIIGGPVAAVFYASVRSLDLMMFKRQLPPVKIIQQVLFILDWVPVRLIALAYALVGNFSNSISIWGSLTLNIKAPAYDVVSKVAMASEQMSKSHGDDGVCMQSTCRLVSLAKRTLLLSVVGISLLTIFGFLL